MIALLQRVLQASVTVGGNKIAAINHGVLVFLAVQKQDDHSIATRMLERILAYRIFSDNDGKMNLNVQDINGEVLLVPQFTLAANTDKGNRPSFSSAAPPEMGQRVFLQFVENAKKKYSKVACGQFGADMKVALVNDGPVTFWLQVGE